MNIFEVATRKKIRFPYKGVASVEDLWDLDVVEFDSIYKSLVRQRKSSEEESLLSVNQKTDSILECKIEIIKHIVETKETERLDYENASKKRAEKQKIMSIISSKKDDELSNKSIEELTKMVDSL